MRAEFESFLKSRLIKAKSFHPYFEEALSYMLVGGKYFRAMLLLGVVKSLKPLELEAAKEAALAVEFVHTYSLIHDDLPVMDDADFRRAKPSLHKKYDEVTALLVGDALNTQAFYLLSKANLPASVRIKLVELLSFNAGPNGMVLGQALDCHFEKVKLELEKLEFLHLHKTGCLIAASLAMGAVIAGEDEKSYYDLGLLLGLIFQINDDIIDETKSSFEAGKPTGADTFKNSFVNLLGLKGAKEAKAKQLELFKQKLASFDEGIQAFLNELVNKYL